MSKGLKVHVSHIDWMDETEWQITESTRIKMGLPYEETLMLEGITLPCDETELTRRCIDALNKEWEWTGMQVDGTWSIDIEDTKEARADD